MPAERENLKFSVRKKQEVKIMQTLRGIAANPNAGIHYGPLKRSFLSRDILANNFRLQVPQVFSLRVLLDSV